MHKSHSGGRLVHFGDPHFLVAEHAPNLIEVLPGNGEPNPLMEDDMARRKKKTTTTRTSAEFRAQAPHLGALVTTQREAIAGVPNKQELAALFLKLAGKHGTSEQQAMSVADLEVQPRETVEAFVANLALKAHDGRKVHLSELGGWPACWTDERREGCGSEELLVTPISVTEEAVTCPKCKKAADIPSPAESAAMERAVVEAEKETTKKS